MRKSARRQVRPAPAQVKVSGLAASAYTLILQPPAHNRLLRYFAFPNIVLNTLKLPKLLKFQLMVKLEP